MVTEHAEITVPSGKEDAFDDAYRAARAIVLASPGCRSVALLRGIETPERYVLLVEWERLEDHTEGFRASPAFAQWRELVGPFFASAPVVEHFTTVAP